MQRKKTIGTIGVETVGALNRAASLATSEFLSKLAVARTVTFIFTAKPRNSR